MVPLSSALHDALAHNSIDVSGLPARFDNVPRRAAIRALQACKSAGCPLPPLRFEEVQDLLDVRPLDNIYIQPSSFSYSP